MSGSRTARRNRKSCGLCKPHKRMGNARAAVAHRYAKLFPLKGHDDAGR